MSLLVQCPTCQHTASFHRTPVERCPRCETAYPETVSVAAENALRHSLAPKPPLLVLGQWICSGVAPLMLLFVPMAAFDIGTYSIDNRPVSGPEFLRAGGPILVLLGGWLAAVAAGLWLDKPWSRWLMLAYWPLSSALMIALGWNEPQFVENTASACVFGAIAMSLAAWYLYRRDNVVAYYDACARDQTVAAASVPLA